MASPIIDLQTGIVQRLANDTALLELMPIDLLAEEEKDRRLYTYVPEEAGSPYIHVDSFEISKVYVKPQDVVDVSFTLHAWHHQQLTGEYGNVVPAKLLQAMKDALRFQLPLLNYQVLRVDVTNERILDDANPDVKHGILSFTYKLMKK